MIHVTFGDVVITVPAATAREAYDLLCAALSTIPGCRFETDTFETVGSNDERDTSELWDDGAEFDGCGDCGVQGGCECVDEDEEIDRVGIVAPVPVDHDIAAWEGEGGRAL